MQDAIGNKPAIRFDGKATSLVTQPLSTVDINFYQLSSANSPGLLDPSGWNSLEEQNMGGFPAGDGAGNGWEEGTGSNENLLVESFLQQGGFSTVSDGASISLGHVFDPTAFGPGVDGDLVFEYHVPGQASSAVGIVQYVTGGPVPGDYNGDGTVNAGDYTVWRDTLGSSTDLRADGSEDGSVGSEDYQFWKSSFGSTSTSASVQAAAVPEPTSILLLGALIGLCMLQPKRWGLVQE